MGEQVADVGAHLRAVVEATWARQAALQVAGEQLELRRLALWELHHDNGLQVGNITNQVRESLLITGMDDAVLQAAGVGYQSISKIVKGPKPGGGVVGE